MAIQELLRHELMEFQKSQSELLRWKLVAIGGIFGLAFIHPVSTIVLIVVPLVAVYCDLLFRNYDIRIALISWYIASTDKEWFDYERSLGASGTPWFLNSSATLLASLGACASVVVVDFFHIDKAASTASGHAVAYFGAAGAVITALIQIYYSYYQRKLKEHWKRKIGTMHDPKK
jgi:hypothetical protein